MEETTTFGGAIDGLRSQIKKTALLQGIKFNRKRLKIQRNKYFNL